MSKDILYVTTKYSKLSKKKKVLFGFLKQCYFFIYLFIVLANANFTGKKSANHTTDFFKRNIFIAMKLKSWILNHQK